MLICSCACLYVLVSECVIACMCLYAYVSACVCLRLVKGLCVYVRELVRDCE